MSRKNLKKSKKSSKSRFSPLICGQKPIVDAPSIFAPFRREGLRHCRSAAIKPVRAADARPNERIETQRALRTQREDKTSLGIFSTSSALSAFLLFRLQPFEFVRIPTSQPDPNAWDVEEPRETLQRSPHPTLDPHIPRFSIVTTAPATRTSG